jgi:hypothetical protein
MLFRPVRYAYVTEPSELPNRPIGGDDAARSATQLTILLDAAKATVDEEFRRSERLDAKSRNQMTLAATMFGVAQAIAVGLVNSVLAQDGTKALILAGLVAGAAIIALGCLAWALALSYGSWNLRDEKALNIETFEKYLGAARAGNPNVGAQLVKQYAKVARDRRDSNNARVSAIERAARACAVTSAWVGVELVLAFAAVILQRT